MSFTRGLAESLAHYRARIVDAWETYVGKVKEYRTRGRKVPAPIAALNAMASSLSYLEDIGIIRIRVDNCVYAGPYALTRVKRGRRRPAPPPSRGALLGSFRGERTDSPYLLEVRFEHPAAVHKEAPTWTRWESALEGDVLAPADWRRFFSLWKAIQSAEAAGSGAGAQKVEFRFCPLPDVALARLYEGFHGEENCAIKLLAAQFPAKSHLLKKVKLTPTGGFSEEQTYEVARILRRNVEVRNLLDAPMTSTTKPDGSPLYAGTRRGAPVPPVVVYLSDGHMVEALPEMPLSVEMELRLVDHDCADALRLKREFGALSRVWPIRDGAVVERWHDKPLLVRTRSTYEGVEKRAHELSVENYRLMGSVFGVECRAWSEQNGFRPTRFARELWAAGITYETPYCTGGEGGLTADLNSAYEACPKVGARDYYERYGMPLAGGMVAFRDIPEESMGEALACTGLAVVSLDLEGCHPWVRHIARGRPEGVYTTMRLQMWVESGAARIAHMYLLVVAKKGYPSLDAPEGLLAAPPGGRLRPGHADNSKDWVREAIGRLAPGAKSQTSMTKYYTTDAPEAASLVHSLASMELLGEYHYITPAREAPSTDEDLEALLRDFHAEEPAEPAEEAQGGFHVIGALQRGLPASACYHVRAYYLDYCGIVVDREVFAHPWEDIVKVKTDSITLAPGKEFSSGVVFGDSKGQWKAETYEPQDYGTYDAKEFPAAEVARVLAASTEYWTPLAGSDPVVVLEAPPGYGKTHKCLEVANALGRKRCTVLVPTRKMRRAFRRDHPELRVVTWQWALRPDSRKGFDPAGVYSRLGGSQLLYIPEIGTWDSAWVEEVLPWLIGEYDCRVLADGDRRQMPPYEGEKPWAYLEAEHRVIDFSTQSRDWRSKEEGLADLKMTLRWCEDNHGAIGVLGGRRGYHQYERFLAEWHPRDYVYITTHEMRKTVHEDLGAVHARKWPDQPVRVRYGETSPEKSGEEEYIGLGDAIPRGAELAYSLTYSSCQGETAGPDETGRSPKLWLFYHKVHARYENCVYVGATRAEYESQLEVVLPPGVVGD